MGNRSKLSPIPFMSRPPAKVTFADDPFLPSNGKDVRVFRASAAYHSGNGWYSQAGQHIRWGSILGIGMATVVSAGFWALLAVIVAHFWG
jgi:hypothetical protein